MVINMVEIIEGFFLLYVKMNVYVVNEWNGLQNQVLKAVISVLQAFHCYLLHLFLITDHSKTSLFVQWVPEIFKLGKNCKMYSFLCLPFSQMLIKTSCIASHVVSCLVSRWKG